MAGAGLLDAVDATAALDLDGDGCSARVTRQNVDRPDRRHGFAAHEHVPLAQQLNVLGASIERVRQTAGSPAGEPAMASSEG